MAKKKDRHKPSRLARVRERIAKQVQTFADSMEKDFTQAVNDLLIEALERRNLWPPLPKEKA